MPVNKAIHFRWSLILSLALLTITVACGPGTETVTRTPETSARLPTNSSTPAQILDPTATIVPPTEAPTQSPTDTLVPTVTATPFIPKATIKIAFHGPLTGDLGWLGQGALRGAELAVAQLAGPLMELGFAIELVPYDDEFDIGIGSATALEIVADPDILCGVGNLTTRIQFQVAEIYHQAGLAFISPSATASFLTGQGYLEINRLIGRNDYEGIAGAQFVKDQGYARVFIITQAGDLPQFIVNHFQDEVERLSLTVVGDVVIDTEDDFDWLIGQVLASEADLVYFSTVSLNQAGTFIRDARAAGFMGTFLGMSGMDNPALVEIAGPLLVDGGGMYLTNAVAPAVYYPGAGGLRDDFLTTYGESPGLFAAEAFDAAAICLKAIEMASQAVGGELPARAEIAGAIRALESYMGISGNYTFDENGEPSPARYFVFQVISPDPADWGQNELAATYELSPP
jgi:branched-chain amino acid transport system substrate-binding protein